ncbi:hypothetical protein J2S53_001265 [Actinopolyspora lacussalsi]|nr:hypothetical protein [Actinopolyspora lacussalsi]
MGVAQEDQEIFIPFHHVAVLGGYTLISALRQPEVTREVRVVGISTTTSSGSSGPARYGTTSSGSSGLRLPRVAAALPRVGIRL